MVNILLGVSGSVATIKADQIVTLLQEKIPQCNVQVLATEHSIHFLDIDRLRSNGINVHRDSDEWSSWKTRGDPVLHIELRKWADLMVIAPLSANTLAKVSNGICDNLLTCVLRAWDFKSGKRVFFAPAMNTCMWDHPVTSQQVDTLRGWGFVEIPPISKTLMCKDTGMGAMAEPASIVEIIVSHLKE